jgi:CRP-like cAMP-binding protein
LEQFFQATYVALDPEMKEKDMLKSFKDTKIELKYGRDDPISEDVQMVARVTGKISEKALELQAFFNWQRSLVPTVVAWAVLLLLAIGHSFVPWRFIFYWLFRVALVVGWAAATIVVPVLRIFPTATIKLKRFFTSRGFLSHIKPKYTSAEGIMAHAEMGKAEKELLLNVGVVQQVRGDRELVERGQWSDLFFYPVTAVLRTGHTTHVKTFLRPVNVLIARFSALNPGFYATPYVMRHLQSVTTMQGGKVVVFEVPSVRLEFQQNPNLAFHFYRWLACSLTKKNDRTLTVKQTLTEAAVEADAMEASLAGAGLDPDEVAPPKQDILLLRDVEKRKQQVMTLREKFGVPADEAVLHIAGDVFRRRMGKKYYGNVFVTTEHLAFLPSTMTQQEERWIADADEVQTAFVDKNGALEILFAGSEVRHLYHDDKNVLNEIVSNLNHMKTAAQSKRELLVKHATVTPENSPPVMKRQNIRAGVSKALQKSASRGSLMRGLSLRVSSNKRVAVSDAATAVPLSSLPSFAEANVLTQSAKTSGSASVPLASASDHSEDGEGEHSEEAAAAQADLTEQAIASAAVDKTQGLVAAGTPPEWKHVRITDMLDAPLVRKLLDKRMKREYAAGSQILRQDVSREVAISVLWKGSAKAVRIMPGKPELFIGYINEGSLFGEMAYLLEANSGASVVAVSDCTVYSLPGAWLDGFFDMDRLFGAQFFEFVCLVLLERAVLAEALVDHERKNAMPRNDDESEGL